MRIDEKDIELIEKYFDGTMNEKEKSVFDNRLSEDIEFAELVKLRRTLPEIWKDAGQYEVTKKEIQGALKEDTEPKVFTLRRIYYAVAAVIFLLVATFVIFFIITNNKNLSDQAAKNKKLKEDSLTIMQQMEQPSKAKKDTYKDIKSEEIGLLLPVEGLVFHYHDTIIFKWVNKNNTSIHLLLLSKYDNKTVKILLVKPGQEMVTVKANELKPGEYYWMLSDRKIKKILQRDKVIIK